MALIKCSECGKEISDKAATCPNCGVQVSPQPVVDSPANKSSAPVKPPAKKKSNVFKIISIIVLVPVIGYLILFLIGVGRVVHEKTTPVTLINETENIAASSWQALPFTCPYTGYLTITASVVKGNEMNIEVIDADAVDSLKNSKPYKVYTNFSAAKTGNYNRKNMMNEGTHYLLLKDNTLGILSSSSSDVQVVVHLSPSNE